MSDGLRDRIAEAIARGYESDHPAPNRHDHLAAQAVIDDLGLTVETVEGVMDPDGDYTARRVVGRWER